MEDSPEQKYEFVKINKKEKHSFLLEPTKNNE